MNTLARLSVTPGIGLPPEEFAYAFPFHFVSDEKLKCLQAGSSLLRMAPDVEVGQNLADVFEVKIPCIEFTPRNLAERARTLLVLQHRRSGIALRGQFVLLQAPRRLVFLGSPWFENAAAMEAAGLAMNDFALHDPISDFLIATQSHQIATKDLQELTRRLERQRQALYETEALYRAAIAAANAVPYQEDFTTDRYTYLGEGIENLTGYAAAEMTPEVLRSMVRDSSDMIVDGTATVTFLRIADRRAVDYRILNRRGEERWISDVAVLLRDDLGTVVGAIGILEDITQRKRVEQRLRASEEEARRLALIAARTASAVMLTDADGYVEWVNDSFCQLTGYDLECAKGKAPVELLSGPQTNTETIAALLESIRSGTGHTAEALGYRRDGQTYWAAVEVQPMFDEHGQLTGYMVVQNDLTARRRDEMRLAQMSHELDAILRLIPGGIVGFNVQGEVVYCNPAFESLTGLAAEVVRGMSAEQFESALRAQCDVDEGLPPSHQLTQDNVEIIYLSRPKRLVLQRTVREIQGVDGEQRWRVVYFRDVTRETEVDRMKSEFLSTAAHELRTPMSSVHGFAELLMSRDFDVSTTRSIAVTIHRQSALLVDMVNELLDLARIESGKGREFNIAEHQLLPIIEDTLTGLLVPGDEREVQVSNTLAGSPKVFVDPAKLRLALMNVLSNAYKYSRGQGEIHLFLCERKSAEDMQVGIRVVDSGMGMSTVQLERIFERFFRADSAQGIPGTGLGMSLVKEIMDIMEGQIEISSQLGNGTQVTLWLKTCQENAACM